MGRRHYPQQLLKLNGTYRKDYHGSYTPEAVGKAIRPDGLSETAGELWDVLLPRLEALELVGEIDTAQFTAMCEWWAVYRNAHDSERKVIETLGALHHACQSIAENDGLSKEMCDTFTVVADAVETTMSLVDSVMMNRVNTMSTAWNNFNKLSGKFGLTPCDRAKLADCGKPKDANPMADYLAKREAQMRSSAG